MTGLARPCRDASPSMHQARGAVWRGRSVRQLVISEADPYPSSCGCLIGRSSGRHPRIAVEGKDDIRWTTETPW